MKSSTKRWLIASIGAVSLSLNLYFGYEKVKIHQDPLSNQISEEFKPFVTAFLEESRKHKLPAEFTERVKLLTVKFGYPKSVYKELAGFCNIDTTTVIIDEKEWNDFSLVEKQWAIDHELGHCLLERTHRHLQDEELVPVSLMFPRLIDQSIYKQNKQLFYNELFTPQYYNKIVENYNLHEANRDAISKFPNEKEFTRFIENYINKDPQESPPPKPKVVQFDTQEISVSKKQGNL